MAVDDSERAAPATRAVALSKPMAKRIAAIAAKVMMNLQSAQSKDQAAHGVQPFEGQFEPDEKEEEDHAQFAHLGDALPVMDNEGLERREDPGKLAQHVGAQEYADHQVGQHGIDADSQEQGHHQPGNPQDDEELLVM